MIYYLLAILTILSSSQQKDKSSLSDLYITFKVDSIKSYDAKDIKKNIFMFSPLGHKNKIWTINNENPQELDLITGEWTLLTKKYGFKFEGQLAKAGIWKDSFTGEIYIMCKDGLVRYFPEKDTFDYINIDIVTALYPLKENIAIGNPNGLYFFNKKAKSIIFAENFPFGTFVGSIQELGIDTLLINNKYFYVISSKACGELKKDRSSPQIKYQYNYLSAETRDKLPAIRGEFREFVGDSISWYYGENELFYTSNEHDYYKFNLFPKWEIRHLVEDKAYLYVLFEEQFVIFNKEYIARNSIYHDNSIYQVLKTELFQKLDTLYYSKMPLDLNLAYAVSIFKEEKYSAYSDLQAVLQSIPVRFSEYKYEEGIDNLHSILENNDIPQIFKSNILIGLCRHYTVTAKLDSALYYFRLLKEVFPVESKHFDRLYASVKRAVDGLDSLYKAQVAPDEYLFYEAEYRENIIKESGSLILIWHDKSIVHDKYKELLTKYPHSKYADDAEFWQINYMVYGDESGAYSWNSIPNIKKFLLKYPDSKHIPELVMNIAYSYSIPNSDSLDERILYLDKGIEELIMLKNNYQLDSFQLRHVKHNINRLVLEKNKLAFTLTIVPLKSFYRMNEDIEVEITISNKSSIPQAIVLYVNESYVTFGIHSEKKVKFVPIGNDDKTKMEFIIVKDEPLKQKVRINRLVRHWDGGKLGRFNFEEEGLYFLQCYSPKYGLMSNYGEIKVNK